VSAGVRFPAIGTTAHLIVTEETALSKAEAILRELLATVDSACSRFREDSALSRLNSAGEGTTVDPTLLAALRVALRAAEQTDGAVDPALGTTMIELGYDRTFAEVPASSPVPVDPTPPAKQAWRRIRIDDRTGTVTLPAGVRLDLGATAKAWAADLAADRVARSLGVGALVNLGGDLAIAGETPKAGWTVRVAADHAASTGGQKLALRTGGLATSSVSVRSWQRGDRSLHHVLDPATGLPAPRVWRYVSVCAASCVDANTASTAALVLGRGAPGWLAARRLPARLVAVDGTTTTVAGWPEEPLGEAA
jgi:thiamine biosynthesis lipoprotein